MTPEELADHLAQWPGADMQEAADHLRRLAALEREREREHLVERVMARERDNAALKRELAARDAAVASWLEAETGWSDERDALIAEVERLRDENAVLSGRVEGMQEMHVHREALEPPVEGVPGLEGGFDLGAARRAQAIEDGEDF